MDYLDRMTNINRILAKYHQTDEYGSIEYLIMDLVPETRTDEDLHTWYNQTIHEHLANI
jgi:hypothetical protein